MGKPAYAGTVVLPAFERTAAGMALGDRGAVLTGLNAIGANPAAMRVRKLELLTQHQSLPLQTHATLLALGIPLRSRRATAALSLLELRSARLDGRDAQGRATGQFSTADRMIGLHLSHTLSLGVAGPFSLGAGIKRLDLRIGSEKASAWALDLGARRDAGRLLLGLSALNLGKGPTFVAEQSKLPTSLGASVGWRPAAPWTLLAGANLLPNESRTELSFGTEFRIGAALVLRSRYGLAPGLRGERLGSLAGGFGLRLLGSSLDYAFEAYDAGLREAGTVGTHRLTLILRLGRGG